MGITLTISPFDMLRVVRDTKVSRVGPIARCWAAPKPVVDLRALTARCPPSWSGRRREPDDSRLSVPACSLPPSPVRQPSRACATWRSDDATALTLSWTCTLHEDNHCARSAGEYISQMFSNQFVSSTRLEVCHVCLRAWRLFSPRRVWQCDRLRSGWSRGKRRQPSGPPLALPLRLGLAPFCLSPSFPAPLFSLASRVARLLLNLRHRRGVPFLCHPETVERSQ